MNDFLAIPLPIHYAVRIEAFRRHRELSSEATALGAINQ